MVAAGSPSYADGVTQARQLDQLPERLADVYELMTGEAINPDEIELAIDSPGAAAAVRANRSRLSRRGRGDSSDGGRAARPRRADA